MPGTIELEYVFLRVPRGLERGQGTTFKKVRIIAHNVLPLNARGLFICINVAVVSAGVLNSSFIH